MKINALHFKSKEKECFYNLMRDCTYVWFHCYKIAHVSSNSHQLPGLQSIFNYSISWDAEYYMTYHIKQVLYSLGMWAEFWGNFNIQSLIHTFKLLILSETPSG